MSHIDWMLRGGYGCLVVTATDTAGEPVEDEAPLVTRSVRPLAYAPEVTTRVLADGTADVDTRVTAIAPEVVGWPQIQTLRRWAAKGYRVTARVLSIGRGPHVLWDEPCRPVLAHLNEGRGSLAGDRLVMETHRRSPRVLESPDLLHAEAPEWDAEGEDVAWPGVVTVALPVEGLRVYAFHPAESYAEGALFADEITVEALDADGDVIASDVDALPSLALPVATRSVRVTSTTRAALTTYPASVVLGEGGYLLLNPETAEADGEADLGDYGRGTVTTGDPVDVVIGGVTLSTNEVDLGDATTKAARTRETPDGLEIDTIPPLA